MEVEQLGLKPIHTGILVSLVVALPTMSPRWPHHVCILELYFGIGLRAQTLYLRVNAGILPLGAVPLPLECIPISLFSYTLHTECVKHLEPCQFAR